MQASFFHYPVSLFCHGAYVRHSMLLFTSELVGELRSELADDTFLSDWCAIGDLTLFLRDDGAIPVGVEALSSVSGS